MAEEMGSEETTEEAERLRAELVEDLVADETIKTEAVRNAFRAVPRHLFVPEASLADAYARFAVTTRTDERGQATSSVSDPHIQAVMLELAGIEPGMSVLEIGSGGYNAALIQELVSATGSVLSVDIDAVVVDRAHWDNLMAMQKFLGNLKGTTTFDQIVDNSFAEKAKAS